MLGLTRVHSRQLLRRSKGCWPGVPVTPHFLGVRDWCYSRDCGVREAAEEERVRPALVAPSLPVVVSELQVLHPRDSGRSPSRKIQALLRVDWCSQLMRITPNSL